MIQITSKADLNRAVAQALCPEPPLSERRAIHESGVWLWNAAATSDCKECDGTGNYYRHDAAGDFLLCDECDGHGEFKTPPHWEPADFCGDPVASYLLRQKMRADGWRDQVRVNEVNATATYQRGAVGQGWGYAEAEGVDELTAVALASLRALGVEFTLAEGWEKR